MSYFQSTYHSKVYRDFKEIESSAYRELIRFYEDREDEINQLDFEENFELLVVYVDALFEVGDYEKHLNIVDLIIEHSIYHNITSYKGKDIYRRMLFRKAASYFNVLAFDKAIYILEELLKMRPKDGEVVSFLKKCFRRKFPNFIRHLLATSMVFLIATAVVYLIKVLLVRPFFSEYNFLLDIFFFLFVSFGVISLAAGFLYHIWQVDRKVQKIIRKAKSKKLSH